METDELTNTIINNKYRLEHKIGKGSFGDVYLGRIISNNKIVAIKVAHNDEPHKRNILYHENEIYNDLIKAKKHH